MVRFLLDCFLMEPKNLMLSSEIAAVALDELRSSIGSGGLLPCTDAIRLHI